MNDQKCDWDINIICQWSWLTVTQSTSPGDGCPSRRHVTCRLFRHTSHALVQTCQGPVDRLGLRKEKNRPSWKPIKEMTVLWSHQYCLVRFSVTYDFLWFLPSQGLHPQFVPTIAIAPTAKNGRKQKQVWRMCGKTVARCGVHRVAVLMHVHSKKPKQIVFFTCIFILKSSKKRTKKVCMKTVRPYAK